MKKKKLSLNDLQVKSFSTSNLNDVKAGLIQDPVYGGDSIMECATSCIPGPGDYCQPDTIITEI